MSFLCFRVNSEESQQMIVFISRVWIYGVLPAAGFLRHDAIILLRVSFVSLWSGADALTGYYSSFAFGCQLRVRLAGTYSAHLESLSANYESQNFALCGIRTVLRALRALAIRSRWHNIYCTVFIVHRDCFVPHWTYSSVLYIDSFPCSDERCLRY